MKRACAVLILSMLENDSDPSVANMAKEIVSHGSSVESYVSMT